MKKLLTFILALVLTFSLVACGGRQKVDISGAKDLAGLKGATIGAQSGTFHLTALDQVDGITKKDYKDFPALLVALNSGVIDGYVAEEPTAYAECLKDETLGYIPLVNNTTGFTATESDTGIAVAFKSGSALVASVNQILATIPDATKKTLMEQAVQMSFDKEESIGTLALSSSKTDVSNGVLKIGMECGYDPFNWTQLDDTNGAVPIKNGSVGTYANGYDVQIAKYIAAELGMKLEIYQYAWEGLIAAVQSSAIDGIIAGMSPTAEREEEVDFTDCYYVSNLVIIYKKAN